MRGGEISWSRHARESFESDLCAVVRRLDVMGW
jgi:hypothetical protein